jgi:hypothetical protein
MMELTAYEQFPATLTTASPESTVAAAPQNSAAIRRLIEEVRFEELTDVSAAAHYNRQHNRHNR